MSLASGTRLGPYEIVAPLGAGGMGEVYRATDSNLKRSVAIKVLPASMASDADRLARFQREAEVLAALNHPNIAAIHGLEKTADLTALVMELVEGEDLSVHIARRPILVADALPIAKQIADALEAAHEQGIVHRDLKPANVKVKDDGTVKVLDFGLAKALTSDAAGGSMENSPTLTARATQLGVILGTAAYMSPEQAKGKTVDRRADIWAFGVVLYEMLTGDRPFKGEDVSDTLAAVLRQEISLAALPATTPPRLRRLLERCLDRDVKTRLRDIGEARIELAKLQSGVPDPTETNPAAAAAAPAQVAPPARSRALPLAVAALAGIVLASLAAWAIVRWTPAPPAQVMRFAFLPSTTSPVSLTATPDRVLVISPDGKHIVYATADGSLMVRPINGLDATPIKGVTGARAPFFSHDSKWIGYFAGAAEIRKVSVTGGPSVLVCAISAPPEAPVGDLTTSSCSQPPTQPPASGLCPQAVAQRP